LSNDRLKQEISAFMEGYSIEATPHDANRLESFVGVVPPGASVYMAHPPGTEVDEVVTLAGRIQALGFSAVPHIIARKQASLAQLEGALARLRELGVDRALVLAGDLPVPDHAFESSLEMLKTGLFSKYGFRQVGVAGHPEGSEAIGDERARQFLREKAAFAKDADFSMYIATQFGFDPVAVTNWERETTAAGVDLPVWVGMAGPTSLRQLIKFAALCGVGASARMLKTRTAAMANLLTAQAPDDQVVHIAKQRIDNPASRLMSVHFFAFGGVAKTAAWANAVVAGNFELNRKGDGFKVVAE
jgi:methylenetetrahydrofolate reductase (NADPH)